MKYINRLDSTRLCHSCETQREWVEMLQMSKPHTLHICKQTHTHTDTHTEKSNFRKDSSLLVIPPPPPYLTNPPPLFMGKIYFMKIYFIRRGVVQLCTHREKLCFSQFRVQEFTETRAWYFWPEVQNSRVRKSSY